MTEFTDRAQAFAYFVGMGWTPAQAAGILANLVAESGLNPAATGDGGQAYGIAQWHGDRQANFAAIIGRDIHGSALEEQFAFVQAELVGTEKAAGDALRRCTTAAESGGVVSRFYERPADSEGEAARRGTLAETILAQYHPESATVPPQAVQAPSQPSPQPEAPMGAIAAFLPMIMQLIPALTGIKGLGAVAAGGAAPAPPVFTPPATGSMHAADYVGLAQVILDTFVKAVPGAQNPAMAVGMAQADPAVAAAASQAVLTHPDVVAELNAQIPVFDKIAQYDKDAWTAQIAGRASATAAQQADTSGAVRIIVNNVAGQSWAIIGGLLVALVGAIVCKAIYPEIPDYVPIVIGPLGMAIGAAQKEMGAIVAHFFDGTPTSNAAAAASEQIAVMNATKKG